MAIDLTYPKILDLIEPYNSPARNESSAFLVWYLINFYRLDELEAVDAICDQPGDKGVDGIYVNEGEGTIDIFQSKISQKTVSSIGDTQLKEFHGTLAQFQSAEALEKLVQSGGERLVVDLIRRLDLQKKIVDYKVRGVFLANLDLDKNGEDYLKQVPIVFAGKKDMENQYVSNKKDAVQTGKASFDIFGLSVTDYSVDPQTKASIAPVLASDLVKLNGIADQSLFSSNVRATLGNTKVNKDIASSIKDPSLHKAFPLFHNGITVLARVVSHDDRHISIEDYFVVNGCQSLNTLYANRGLISDDLRILTKFIQVKVDSSLAQLITTNSNNQNGVKPRDFKSNHPIQTRLQNEFNQHYAGQYAFSVKRGEPINGQIEISNEEAGLLLIAFDIGEPWTTHRKYQVFDDRYTQIFGRPEVNADRIVLLHEIGQVVVQHLATLKNALVGKYVLTKFLVVSAIRKILETDELGLEVIRSPEKFVRSNKDREAFKRMIHSITEYLVVDLDVETQSLPPEFDYRGWLRDKERVTQLLNSLLASFRKDLLKKRAQSISEAWKAAQTNG